jgi:hypothetical protein
VEKDVAISLRSFRSAEFELGHHDLFSAASLLALVID